MSQKGRRTRYSARICLAWLRKRQVCRLKLYVGVLCGSVTVLVKVTAMQRLSNDTLVLIATFTEDSSVVYRFLYMNHTAHAVYSCRILCVRMTCHSLWWFVQSRDVFQEKGVPLSLA